MKGKSPPGSTIIYVLFIMLIAMILTSTLTSIMLRSIKVTSGYSESAQSYYAAESGIERGLYYVQWARDRKTVGVQSAVGTISDYGDTLSFGARYDVAATVTDDNFQPDLALEQNQQWDIFGEDYVSGYHLIPLPDLDNIAIDWNEPSACDTGTSQIEVSFSSWTQFQWEDISDPDTVQTRFVELCPGTKDASPYDCTGSLLGVDDSHLYRVRLKPVQCDLEDVTVTALDATGAAIPTYNVITITSTATYLNSQRTLKANTLWHPPLQHYFDFVLFSEDQITK